MLSHAAARGIKVVEGIAERLPLRNDHFDYALVVTTLCFVDSPEETLAEAHRVLKPDGSLTIGFIDRQSELGQHFQTHKDGNAFYREAVFYSADEVECLLVKAGFAISTWGQTLALPLHMTQTIEPFSRMTPADG